MQQLISKNDTDAEKLVLVSMILCPELFDDPLGQLPESAFYSEKLRKLFVAARTVYRETGCADAHLVAAQAREKGMDDAPLQLWGALLDPVVADSPTYCTVYFGGYVQRLRRVYVQREQARAALTYQQAIADGGDESEARIVLDSTLDALQSMDPWSVDDDEILGLLAGNARYLTGYADLDRMAGGMTRPGLNILAARPSVGKSALARGIIRHAARRGDRVFWYSIDQSSAQIFELEIARVMTRNSTDLRNMDKEQLRPHLRRVREEVWRNNVVLIDKPLTLPVLVSHARASGADLVVVDYLQAVDSGVASEREYDAVTRVSKTLKALALEMGVPVLALSQLSRGAKAGEAPSLAHLRASGQIEQDADQVWGLQRDNEASNENASATLHVLKNKTGPTVSVELSWVARYAVYEDAAGAWRASSNVRSS